jgi:hypothetical protein
LGQYGNLVLLDMLERRETNKDWRETNMKTKKEKEKC